MTVFQNGDGDHNAHNNVCYKLFQMKWNSYFFAIPFETTCNYTSDFFLLRYGITYLLT